MCRILNWLFSRISRGCLAHKASPASKAAHPPGLLMVPAGVGALPESELARRIEAHARWLDSGGASGARADLRGEALRFSNLFMARLERADLSGADLRNANVQWANLSGANLEGAKLGDADLFQSNLSGANLRSVSAPGASFFLSDLQGAG